MLVVSSLVLCKEHGMSCLMGLMSCSCVMVCTVFSLNIVTQNVQKILSLCVIRIGMNKRADGDEHLDYTNKH